MYLSVDVRRLAVGSAASALLVALGTLLHAQAPSVNNPPAAPRSILVFPQRDFVSSSGFEAGDLVTVEVFHPSSATPASRAANVVPQDDPATPGFDGIVEVNHPGGACWATVTPDIRPGDRVRTTRRTALGAMLGIDETTVANVVAHRPVQTAFDTVVIHGTAQNANGTPIDITQLEQRLVAPRDAFDLNGRRTLRASSVPGADGVLSWDIGGGTAWTATYTGLDAADVTRALNAESRIMWLGGNPGAGVEATLYEIGAGITPGPSAPCAAPLEILPPPPGSELVPPAFPAGATLTATVAGANTVRLSWPAASDNVGVTSYGIYRNGVAIANVESPVGAPNPPTTYDDFNVPPGTYSYSVDAADAVGNRSPRLSASATTAVQHADVLPVCTGALSAACVSDPPAATPTQVQIIAFPARDFTSSSGYDFDDATVTVQVIRNGLLISTANVIPVDDPTTVGFDGIVEVNHPGGGCWMGVTPDLRAGDIVRQIAYGADGPEIRRIDQIHVANVSVERPQLIQHPSGGASDGIIEVHGTAIGPNGGTIPLEQLNQRLVVPRDRFNFNDRRTLRAGVGEDFALSYDAGTNPDGRFTATYTGLDEDDMYRAIGGTTSAGRTFPGAESRILFLGNPTAVAPEMTIYENSDQTTSGPAAGACNAPLETLDTQAPSAPVPSASQVAGSNSVELTWSPSNDDGYVLGYGVYRREDDVNGASFVRIANIGGVLPGGATTFSFVDSNVPVGAHTYAVDAVDSGSPLKADYPLNPNDVNPGDPIHQGVLWGNRSVLGIANAVHQGDVVKPTAPANLVAKVIANTSGPDSIVLAWTASADNVGVTSYRVYRNGVALARDVTGAPPSAAFTDTIPPVTVNTALSYTVDAADAANNRSGQSMPVTVIVSPKADSHAPSAPKTLTASTRDVYTGAAPAIGPRDVKLSWSGATDDIGIAGYGIYRRPAASLTSPAAAGAFQKIADVNGELATYTDATVAIGTYDYSVDAVDSAGNRSAKAPFALDVVTVDDPPHGPHAIFAFPQRDFVSSTGYAIADGPIVVSVIRGGKVWARSTAVNPVEDPATPGLGAVEVNHPGGGCWDTAALDGLPGITPDLRSGDIVRFTNKAGKAEQTTVANVRPDRATDRRIDGSLLPAGTLRVRGTAQDAAGHPLPVEAVEIRLIADGATLFNVNGRRVLRAGGAGSDGIFAYDPIGPGNLNGTAWTATFSGLDAADVETAKAAESRAMWLGRDPLALTEETVFENGAGVIGGPSGGSCTAPAEAGPAILFTEATPVAASFDPSGLAVVFPPQSTDTSASQTLVLTNIGAADAARAITGTLSIASVGLESGGDFSLTANSCGGATVASNDSCAVTVKFSPTASGTRTGRLVITGNANNSAVQVFALSGEAFDAQAPVVTAPVMTLATGTPMNVSGNALTVTVAATATDASGVASMQLDRSTDGRTWSALKTSTTGQVATSMLFPLGSTYQFRASAADTLGNASAPVSSGLYRLSVTDDNAATPKFVGSWSTQRNNAVTLGALASTIHEATAPQAGKTNTVTFTFTGTEVALLAAIGPDRGQVSMSVDGGAAQTIELYAPAQQQATVVGAVAGLGSGTHTVTVNVLRTRHASSSNTRVDVDGFIVKF
jgi:hypothetical protein